MSPPLDSQLLHFDLWESLDEESMRLTETSEFWTQIQYETDRLDLVPPASQSDSLQDSDEDWRIMETYEDPHKDNIVHHDCMWAGSCVDSVHPSNTFVPSDHIPATPGQSLLRRDISPSRPDTPPSLDGDEPPQFRHSVDVAGTALRLLRDSAVVAADHSYTLARQHRDYLGVQTPSDSGESEEEIDVVSVGTTAQQPFAPTATAPNNMLVRSDTVVRTASMPDRRQAQRPVESATSRTARSPPRGIARKRLVPPASIASGGSRRRARGPGRRGRRSNTDTDSEAESLTNDRRFIHNDMERQRRIGLKNLFDELKMQIPATRDKERAPKVVILREAAALCRKLSQEDIEREKLRKRQNQLMARLKKLRKSLSARYHSY